MKRDRRCPDRASASPAQLGLDVVFVNGTHHESHGDVRASGVPAPMLRLTKDSGRFEFFVEGIPPMGGIPGVREAIEQKRWSEVGTQMTRVSRALQNEADLLDEATKQIAVAK